MIFISLIAYLAYPDAFVTKMMIRVSNLPLKGREKNCLNPDILFRRMLYLLSRNGRI